MSGPEDVFLLGGEWSVSLGASDLVSSWHAVCRDITALMGKGSYWGLFSFRDRSYRNSRGRIGFLV